MSAFLLHHSGTLSVTTTDCVCSWICVWALSAHVGWSYTSLLVVFLVGKSGCSCQEQTAPRNLIYMPSTPFILHGDIIYAVVLKMICSTPAVYMHYLPDCTSVCILGILLNKYICVAKNLNGSCKHYVIIMFQCLYFCNVKHSIILNVNI